MNKKPRRSEITCWVASWLAVVSLVCLKLRSFCSRGCFIRGGQVVNLNPFHADPIDAKAVLRKSASKLNFSLSGNSSSKNSAEKSLDPTFVILKLDHSLALSKIQAGIWHLKDSTLMVSTLDILSQENQNIEIVPSILKAHFLTVPPKPLSRDSMDEMEKKENHMMGVQDFWVVTTSNGAEIKDLWEHMLRSNTKFLTKAETKNMSVGLVCFSSARDALMICEYISDFQKTQTGTSGSGIEITHLQCNPLSLGLKVRAYSKWDAVVEWWSISSAQMNPAALWNHLKTRFTAKIYKGILETEPMAYRRYETFGAIAKAYEEMRSSSKLVKAQEHVQRLKAMLAEATDELEILKAGTPASSETNPLGKRPIDPEWLGLLPVKGVKGPKMAPDVPMKGGPKIAPDVPVKGPRTAPDTDVGV